VWRRSWLAVLALFCLISPVMPEEDHKEAIAQAARSARDWLALVDRGEYGAAYDTAAAYLKGSIKRPEFEAKMLGARSPLGKLLSRTLDWARYMTTLPGAPDGEYVVMKFQSSFENRKSAVETISPMREKNGKWHVAGYYIK